MRLIDADKLFEFVMSEEGAEILRHSTNMTLRVKDIIERQPTIEAEPVRHGQWIHTDMAVSWKPSCRDECGECHYHDKDHRDLSDFKFCPMCGSEMDGGEEES